MRKAAPCVRTADDAPAVVASSRLWPILVASGSQLPVVTVQSRSSPRHLAVSCGDDDDDDEVEHLAVSSGWSGSCSGKREGRVSKCTFN